jgi:hypothetical protein
MPGSIHSGSGPIGRTSMAACMQVESRPVGINVVDEGSGGDLQRLWPERRLCLWRISPPAPVTL